VAEAAPWDMLALGGSCIHFWPNAAMVFVLRRGSGEGGAQLFSLGCSDRMYGNGSKLPQWRFRPDIRKHFFTERVVKPWNRLVREVVNAPSLSVLANALNNML